MIKPIKADSVLPSLGYPSAEMHLLLSYFKQNTEGIAITDLTGRMLFVNPAFARMHGYRTDELCGRNITVLHTRQQLSTVLSANRKLKQTGHFLGEIWHRRKDGTVFPGVMLNSVIRDINGEPMYMVGTLRDDTQKKQLEHKLRQSEERFSKMANVTSAAILIYQGDKFVYANPAAIRLSGYTEEEILSKRYWDLVHPDCKELVIRCGRARQEGKSAPKRYELRIVTKSGDERWADFAADAITYNGRPAGIITAIDRTGHKQAEESLRRSEERYHCLADHSLNGIALVQEGKHIYVNDSFCRIFGYRRRELLGKDMLCIVAPGNRKLIQERVKQRLGRKKVPVRYTFRGLRKNGKTIHVEVAACVMRVNEDAPILMAIFRDFTEQRRLENQLLEHRSQLEHMVEKRTARLRLMNEKLRGEIQKREETAAGLERKTIALREVLSQLEVEKRCLYDDVIANIDHLVSPIINRLKMADGREDRDYLGLLERTLKEVTSTFGRKISDARLKLTPREIEICDLIKSGLSSKEMAALLKLSIKTLEGHRETIRKKLTITDRKISLSSYLQTF